MREIAQDINEIVHMISMFIIILSLLPFLSLPFIKIRCQSFCVRVELGL